MENEELKQRVLKVLNEIGGLNLDEDEINDDTNLEEFGLDNIDKNDGLPLELRAEFDDVYFSNLDHLKTLGELVDHVRRTIN